jgi:hypothetical protein
MPFDKNGEQMQAGGLIPVKERTAYLTYSDKSGRTNAGVLVANYRVTSRIDKQVFEPHNGFITANIDVVYELQGIDVMKRQCQIMMRPDKSEATIRTSERFFADLSIHDSAMVTITREQFEVMRELFDVSNKR